jgi:hypothetical protein
VRVNPREGNTFPKELNSQERNLCQDYAPYEPIEQEGKTDAITVINDDSNSRRIDKKPSEFVFLHANSLNVKRIYREQRSCRESQLIETSRFLRKTMKNM